MVGSYFPDGIAALEEILSSNVPVKTFYDIDTPITVRNLREQGGADYLLKRISRTGRLFQFYRRPHAQASWKQDLHAPFAVPLYCSVDPEKHRELPADPHFACDLSYMGTYAPDRQPKIDELLCAPARRLPEKKFIVAGPQYPLTLTWPVNVEAHHAS